MNKTAAKILRGIFLTFLLAMIIGSTIYIIKVLLEYHRGVEEYDQLREELMSQAESSMKEEAGDGENILEDIGTDEETELTEEEKALMRKRRGEAICGALADLQAKNEDVVGWIDFDNMDISYPVMQGVDNDEYIYHTYSKQYNSSGSIFLEAQNSPDFEDSHTIIYGHNMKNGSMFGKLKNYNKEDFYEEHRYFTIYTADEAMLYEIFSYYDVEETSEIYDIWFDTDVEFQNLVNGMQRRSYCSSGVTVGADDHVITLSTCSTEGRRFVVHAKRVEW